MNILVTGSTGALGPRLMQECKRRGHNVSGLASRHGENNIRADVANYRELSYAWGLVRPDVCFHLAGEFGRRNGDQYHEKLWNTNCVGTKNVIEMCSTHGTKLIFASSSEVYGRLADSGICLEGRTDITPPRFHNEYALSKWTNERQIMIAQEYMDLKAVILRFFNVYGPGERYSPYRSVVCKFIYGALKGKKMTVYQNTLRSFLFVDDWARTVANTIDYWDEAEGKTINVASDEEVNMGVLAITIDKKLGKSSDWHILELEEQNVARKTPYTLLAQDILRQKNIVALPDGLDLTIEWMRQQYE